MSRLRLLGAGLGAGCLLLLTTLNSPAFAMLSLGVYGAAIQFALLVAGVVLLGWGLGATGGHASLPVARHGTPCPDRTTPHPPAPSPIRRGGEKRLKPVCEVPSP